MKNTENVKDQAKLTFEPLSVEGLPLGAKRAKLPGGWLLIILNPKYPAELDMSEPIFIPDPRHQWGKKITTLGDFKI